jgi:hypothetical protein
MRSSGTFMATLYRSSGTLWPSTAGLAATDIVWFSRMPA